MIGIGHHHRTMSCHLAGSAEREEQRNTGNRHDDAATETNFLLQLGPGQAMPPKFFYSRLSTVPLKGAPQARLEAAC